MTDSLSSPIVMVAAIVLIGFLALLAFALAAGTMLVLAFGAKMWATATSEVYRARLHGAQVLETQQTIEAATEATEEVRRAARARVPMPTDDELRASLLEEREHDIPDDVQGADPQVRRTVDEMSTLWNQGLDYESPVPGTEMYVGKP